MRKLMGARRACTLILAALAATAAGAVTPPTTQCAMIGTSGCAEGVCIGDRLRSDFLIAFDFGKGRLLSKWGGGRITQRWDTPDGRHQVIVSAPPAGAEMSFSADWTSATLVPGKGSVLTYRCEPISLPD